MCAEPVDGTCQFSSHRWAWETLEQTVRSSEMISALSLLQLGMLIAEKGHVYSHAFQQTAETERWERWEMSSKREQGGRKG